MDVQLKELQVLKIIIPSASVCQYHSIMQLQGTLSCSKGTYFNTTNTKTHIYKLLIEENAYRCQMKKATSTLQSRRPRPRISRQHWRKKQTSWDQIQSIIHHNIGNQMLQALTLDMYKVSVCKTSRFKHYQTSSWPRSPKKLQINADYCKQSSKHKTLLTRPVCPLTPLPRTTNISAHSTLSYS